MVVLHESGFDLESISTYVFLALFILLNILASFNFTIDLIDGRQRDQNAKIKVKKHLAQFEHILNELPAGCLFVKTVEVKPVEGT